jgi:hypothetical protein
MWPSIAEAIAARSASARSAPGRKADEGEEPRGGSGIDCRRKKT